MDDPSTMVFVRSISTMSDVRVHIRCVEAAPLASSGPQESLKIWGGGASSDVAGIMVEIGLTGLTKYGGATPGSDRPASSPSKLQAAQSLVSSCTTTRLVSSIHHTYIRGNT